MSVISGTRRGMKELVDGTIRVQIDIDPIHRADFFALFSRIDMPVAIAPLVANFERIKPGANQSFSDPKNGTKPDSSAVSAVAPTLPKGGELAKWAGILSNDPVFWQWADVENAEQAAELIRRDCDIDSRAELDHDANAAKIFRNMMGEFSTWKDGGEAA